MSGFAFETTLPESFNIIEPVSVHLVNWLLEDYEDRVISQLTRVTEKKWQSDGKNALVHLASNKKSTIDETYKLRTYRYFSKGYQGALREIRNSLLITKCFDIDSENSRPTLQLNYCKENNIECSFLEDYINRREEILQMAIDAGLAKDRSSAKSGVILAMLNGGWSSISVCDEKYNWFIDFLTECKKMNIAISKRLKKDSRGQYDEYCEVAKRKEKNVEEDGIVKNSIIVNYHFMHIETMITYNSLRWIQEHTNYVDITAIPVVPIVPSHDGFNIIHNGNSRETVERIIAKLLEWLNLNSINIILRIKDMKDLLPLDNYDRETPVKSYTIRSLEYDEKGVCLSSYKKIKEVFELDHFRINGKVFMISLKQLFKYNEIKDCYSFLFYNEKYTDDNGEPQTRKVLFISKWWTDINGLFYEKIDFLPPPQKCDKTTYNLWEGFSCDNFEPATTELENEKALKDIHDLMYAICGGEDKNYDYWMKWLAYLKLYPGLKNGISILFKSVEGCGKNVMMNFIQKCFGSQYFVDAIDPNSVFGKFNSISCNKLLITFDEFAGGDGYKYSDKIKDLITNETSICEQKGKDSFKIMSFLRAIFLSNGDFPIKISDSDRRFAVFGCLSTYKRDSNADDTNADSIFKRIMKYGKNPEVRYWFMKKLDKIASDCNLLTFDWETQRPITQLYKDMQFVNLNVIEHFIMNLYNNESITDAPPTNYNKQLNTYSQRSTEFYEIFRAWSTVTGHTNSQYTNITKFGIKLAELKVDGLTKTIKRTGSWWVCDLTKIYAHYVNKGYIAPCIIEEPVAETKKDAKPNKLGFASNPNSKKVVDDLDLRV